MALSSVSTDRPSICMLLRASLPHRKNQNQSYDFLSAFTWLAFVLVMGLFLASFFLQARDNDYHIHNRGAYLSSLQGKARAHTKALQDIPLTSKPP